MDASELLAGALDTIGGGGKLVTQAIVIAEVILPDGEREFMLGASDMPEWTARGLLAQALRRIDED